jgi:O-antigen/teichoic acid export membrane protein
MTEKISMPTGMPPAARAARGATYLYIQGIISNLMGVFYFVYATRMLPVSDIGLLAALQMLALFFANTANFAVHQAGIKYTAEHVGRNSPDIVKGVIHKTVLFGLLTSCLFSLICFAAAPLLATSILGQADLQFLITLLAVDIFALNLTFFLSGIFLGLQKFKVVAVINILTTGATRFLLAATMLYLGYGVLGVLIGWIAGDFANILTYLTLTPLTLRTKTKATPFKLSTLLKYSLPLYGSNLLIFIAGYVDIFLVLTLTGFYNLGIYNAAVLASTVVGVISISIGNVLFPQFSEFYGKYGENFLKEASTKAARYVSLLIIPIAVGAAALSYPIMTLFAGLAYEAAAPPLTVISTGIALSCLTVVVNAILLSLGKTKTVLTATTLAILSDITVCILLIPHLGVVGAALGRATLAIINLLCLLYAMKRSYGFHYDRAALAKAWLSTLVMALILIALQWVKMERTLLPLYVAIGILTYAAMLKATKALNHEDAELAKAFLPKKLGKLVNFTAKILCTKSK